MKRLILTIFTAFSLSLPSAFAGNPKADATVEVKLLRGPSDKPMQQANVRVNIRVETETGKLVHKSLAVTNQFGKAIRQLKLSPGNYRILAASEGTGTSGESNPAPLAISLDKPNETNLSINLN